MGGILFRALIFILAVGAAGTVMAAEQIPAAKSVDAPLKKEDVSQIRNEQEKLFEKLQRLDKKMQVRFERADKSIQDGPNFRDLKNLEKIIDVQNNRIDRFLSFAGWYSILLIIAIAALGVGTYVSARKRAEDAVKEEAKDVMDMWLKNNEGKILKLFSKKIKSISSEAIDDVKEQAQEAKYEQKAISLFNKGALLAQAKEFTEALAIFDKLISRFKDAEEPNIREIVASALFNKGNTLGDLDRFEDAIAVYDDIIRRFGDTGDEAIRDHVGSAFNGKAFEKLRDAKKIWQTAGKKDEARKLLSESLSEIVKALEITPDHPIYLGNKGYVLFLLGRKDDAEPVLRRALELGGEALRDAELEDADIHPLPHPLPQDEEFKALIWKLWQEVSAEK